MAEPRMIQIPFGPGLDKESGAMVVSPGSMLDLRNVYHHEGSLVVREGMEKKIQFTDYQTGEDATHILAGIAIRSERIGIVVSFYEPTRHVTIHRVDGTASYGTPVGNWPFSVGGADYAGSLANWIYEWPGTDIPKVILEEIYGQVYFAHDERYISRRAQTWVYDPYFIWSGGYNGLFPLVVYFDADHRYSAEKVHGLPLFESSVPGKNERAEVVQFRGVSRHMDYLFGWGYGTRDENRPEMVRVSYPGEPRRWHPEHYFIAGDRRDPVMRCEPARQTMLCFKETETYQIFGYSRATFGIRPYDQLYGCLAGRLARTVSGEVFFWSAEGPRVGGDVGPSQKVHLPLDLGGFEPATLVERTDFDEGWCDYIDEVELLYFGFGRRLYVLSLRNPQNPRWTYWELARKAYCGFRLYGETGGAAPEGFPDNLSVADVATPDACGLPSIRVTWDNNDQLEDENYIDIWVKPNSPAYVETNLLPYDFNGFGSPTGWTLDATGNTTGEEIYGGGTDPESGLRTWFVGVYGSTTADDEVILYQVVTGADVVVGNEYRFEVEARAYYDYVKTDTHGILVRMEFLDSGDSLLGSVIERVFNQGWWCSPYVEGTAPANTAKIRVTLGASVAAGGKCYAEFQRPELVTKSAVAWRRMDLGRPAPIVTGDDTQSVVVTGLRYPGFDHTVAARYTNSAGIPTAGYESADPLDWPAGSRTTHTITPATPAIYVRKDFLEEDYPYEVDPSWGPNAFDRDNFGPPFWTCYRICGSSVYPGVKGPYRLPVEVEWDSVTAFAYLSERRLNDGVEVNQRFRVYDPEDFNAGAPALVRMRFLGPDANSEWSTPVLIDPATNLGGVAPTVTVTSPASGQISIDWAWGTTAAPAGQLRNIIIECDYDGIGDTGDYVRIYGPCGEGAWNDPTPGGNYICLGIDPSDPYVVDLPGSPGGVTVSVRVREVYVPECTGDPYAICGWNWLQIGHTFGKYSDPDSVAVTA